MFCDKCAKPSTWTASSYWWRNGGRIYDTKKGEGNILGKGSLNYAANVCRKFSTKENDRDDNDEIGRSEWVVGIYISWSVD